MTRRQRHEGALFLVGGVVLLNVFLLLIWPTPYVYDSRQFDDIGETQERVNRFTGERLYWIQGQWREHS